MGALLSVMAIVIVFTWPYQNASSKPANSWRTLVPGRATRADVERLLGKPQGMVASSPLYELPEENVLFTYSRGNCDPQDGGWNVPAGTIIEIEIIPQGKRLLGKAGFDLSKYRRTETQHPPAIIYTNVEEGVTITARLFTEPEDILHINLRPSVRELEFACPAKPAN